MKNIIFHIDVNSAFLSWKAVYRIAHKSGRQDLREMPSIKMRDHPLDAQRILYLYDMLNIFIVTDNIQMLPIRENILEKSRIVKRLTDAKLPKRDLDYLIANESVQKLKGPIKNIREKIPRMDYSIEINIETLETCICTVIQRFILGIILLW